MSNSDGVLVPKKMEAPKVSLEKQFASTVAPPLDVKCEFISTAAVECESIQSRANPGLQTQGAMRSSVSLSAIAAAKTDVVASHQATQTRPNQVVPPAFSINSSMKPQLVSSASSVTGSAMSMLSFTQSAVPRSVVSQPATQSVSFSVSNPAATHKPGLTNPSRSLIQSAQYPASVSDNSNLLIRTMPQNRPVVPTTSVMSQPMQVCRL